MAWNTQDVTMKWGWGVCFDCTAVNGTEKILIFDGSNQRFWLTSIYMYACGSSNKATLFDGSAGTKITGVIANDNSTGLPTYLNLDLWHNPLEVGCGTVGSSLCISGGATGYVGGFITGYTG